MLFSRSLYPIRPDFLRLTWERFSSKSPEKQIQLNYTITMKDGKENREKQNKVTLFYIYLRKDAIQRFIGIKTFSLIFLTQNKCNPAHIWMRHKRIRVILPIHSILLGTNKPHSSTPLAFVLEVALRTHILPMPTPNSWEDDKLQLKLLEPSQCRSLELGKKNRKE